MKGLRANRTARTVQLARTAITVPDPFLDRLPAMDRAGKATKDALGLKDGQVQGGESPASKGNWMLVKTC